MKVAFAVLSCLAISLAVPLTNHQLSKRQTGTPYQLPDGIEILVGRIQSTFTCDNKPYGYYADTENNCQIFHVCLPIEDDVGQTVDTAMYSFGCGNQTQFDQEALVCAHAEDATPCVDAVSLYQKSNGQFGQDAPFRF